MTMEDFYTFKAQGRKMCFEDNDFMAIGDFLSCEELSETQKAIRLLQKNAEYWTTHTLDKKGERIKVKTMKRKND